MNARTERDAPAISHTRIYHWGACEEARETIKQLYPDGVPMTVDAAMALHAAGVDVLWGAVRLLTPRERVSFILITLRQRQPHIVTLFRRVGLTADADAIAALRFDTPADAAAAQSVFERARVSARDRARDRAWVSVWDSAWVSARVSVWDSAWVSARVSARDSARDSARVSARDSAWVSAWVSAWDSARDSARVSARDRAWVSAWDSARVSARDSARVSARDSAVREQLEWIATTVGTRQATRRKSAVGS